MLKTFTVVVLALLGIALGIGGVWLAALGGSPFYIIMAIGLIATAVLLYTGNPAALWAYAALLLITLGWAIWEVGMDWWALVPRGVLLTLIGIWLLIPAVTRSPPDRSRTERWYNARAALTAAVLIAGATAIGSNFVDGHATDGVLLNRASTAPNTEPYAAADWPFYGGDRYGRRYSSLKKITPENVASLKVAWTYHTGETRRPTDPNETTFEVTPIKVGETLYLCTPRNRVIALDATTGHEKWTFDPNTAIDKGSEHLTCRGVSYHANAGVTPVDNALCATRLLVPTMDARLFALDATTGKPCPGFGQNGEISLLDKMPNPKPGFYMVTSPPVIAGDIAIFGSAINDNASVNNPSGVIRAYNVFTGVLVWAWDPGAANPNATPPEGDFYSAGAPNMWTVGSADIELGLAYIPLGNKSPDQYGANRSPEVERTSSSVAALDIKTGQLRWIFQTVHHDLWDRDVPSQPVLLNITTASGVVPALVQPTKQGDLYVLDRRDGKPIIPVTETTFEGKAGPGDFTSPTQPRSALSYMPAPLKESDMWGGSPLDQLYCRILYRSMYYTGPYTPPSLKGSIVYPGNLGVFNWGSVAVDPERQILIGTPTSVPFRTRLVKRDNDIRQYVTKGKAIFGENFGGPYAAEIGPFVSMLGLPCNAPPWGMLIGADLTSGVTAWRHRSGTTRDSMGGIPLPLKMGVPGLGGPMITAGGVFFYSGALDNYLRAFDVTSGKQLWQGRLPAGGQATPMTYLGSDGRQIVVIAAGGHGSFGTTPGDAVVAYALQ